ncbi:MAG: transposase [Deltaproteobacteria bacterium HGW-Deltaproteobacteria-23]|nr:MAG: transposase [Deltaproteobacteria bacterium HGW-Deltaproteobacteria-23]
MLISRSRKFIFVHIYKNAGTSITNALLPFASTAFERKADNLLRKYNIRYFDPLRYDDNHGHLTAAQLISKISPGKFKQYFSFAIVRNPWDWQASLYTFMLKNREHRQHELIKSLGSFDSYIEWRCREEVRLQKDFVFDEHGHQLVSFIGRYENLAEDFKIICQRIGISAELPKLNTSQTRPYQEYYNKETISMVADTFAPDINAFGYEF